jgi:hypothetical protein
MAKTVAERLAEGRKNRQAGQSSIQSPPTSSVAKRLAKARLSEKIKFDTFEDDLKSLGTTVESVYTGWQPKETIENTKSSVAAMQERLNAYNEYAKMFGDGKDVSDLTSGYQTVLEDLDALSTKYSKFKTAEDYTKADERMKSLPTADLKAVSAEVADLDKQIAEIKAQKQKYDSEYSNKGGYVPSASHYNRPAYSQIDEYQEWTAKSSEYDKQIKELENKKADRQAYYDDAKSTQETLATIQKETKMASDPKNMDAFNQYIANYDAARAKEKEATANTPWWVTAIGEAGMSSDNPVNQTLNTVIKQKREDKSWQLPQGDWSDDEKRVLGGYFAEDPQKAIDYVVKKNNEKAGGEKDKTKQKITESATSGFGAGAAHTAGAIVTAPLGLADYLDDVTDKLAGKPITEESFVTPFEYSQTVKGGISENLNEMSGTLNENIPILGGKGLGDAYGMGVSVLESGASAHALGAVGTAISYFGQGAAAGVDDALARGATDDQALLYGFVLGAAEAGSEYMGADRLLKLGSANEVRNILAKGFKNGGGKEFWSLVNKQGVAEGLEELVSGVSGQIADDWILEGKSNFELKAKEYRALGMSAEEATRKAWRESIEDVAYDAVSGYLSGAVHAGPQLAVSTIKQNAENKTEGAKLRGNERISDVLNIASLSPQESDAYAAYTEYAKQGIGADNITDAQIGNLYGMVENDARDVLKSKKSTDEQKADAETTFNRLAKAKTKNAVPTVAEAMVKTDEENKTTAIPEREALINEIAGVIADENEAKANLFRLVDDGKTNAVDYAESFNRVVAMAKDEYSVEEILENRGVLSTGQVNSIYQSVVTNPKVAQQERLDALVKKYDGSLEIKGTVDDSAIDYGNKNTEGKINWKDIHPNVKATIGYISGFATHVAGMDVKLVTNGRDYGFTGMYDRQGNNMLVDITALTERVAGADTKGRKDNSKFVISTVAHEVTHWMEEKAPTLYSEYDKMVMDALTSGGLTEAEVLGRRRALLEKAEAKRAEKENRKPREITDKEVRREVIARASEDMLALSEEGKKFFESMTETEQNQFVGKIKEVIRNIKEWIKNVLSTLKSDAVEARELRALAKELDAISAKWDEMLSASAKANAAMKKEGINDKVITESKAGDTQNADIDDTQGEPSSKITADMSDAERYKILKNRKMRVAVSNKAEYERVVSEKPKLLDRRIDESDAKKLLKKIGSEFGVFAKYSNSDFEIEFEFGKNNMDESLHKQKGNYEIYAQMLSCFPDVIANAVGIEIHNRNSAGYKKDRTLKNFYVLCSVFENGTDVIPVKLEIKEFTDKPNRLYVAVALEGIKKDRVKSMGVPNNRSHVRTSPVTISIHELFSKINPLDVDFLKYIPNGFLNAEQKEKVAAKLDADYTKAVESKDMDAVHWMVLEAAKRAGYTIEAYHGSRNEFSIFSSAKRGSATNTETSKRWFFAGDKATANSYYPYGVIEALQGKEAADKIKNKGKLYHLFLRMSNPLEVDVKDYDYAAHRENRDAMMEYSEQAENNGNDGIILYHALDNQLDTSARESTVYMFRDSAQAKSADAITYDDNGDVIPLSKRFDASNEDIRYSDIDSEGNELSVAQQEYFKDSVIRNANGNLIPMYHGTEHGGFTIFGGRKDYWYFSNSKKYSYTFAGRKKNGQFYPSTKEGIEKGYYNSEIYKVYLDVKNPFVTDDVDVVEYALYWDKSLAGKLREKGYDALMLEDMSQVIVLNANQIKRVDNKTPTADPDIRYSDIDSEGNELSVEQQEFFKDSTVRDENGNLKVMYHGTPNAGFTKFRSGTYFTEHKWYAERYKERSASSLSYKKTADNPDVYAVYLNIQKPFDTRNPEEARIFNEEYFGHYGMGTPLMESGLPDWLDGMDLQEFLEEQGYDYDGLILDEGSVGGYGEEVVNRGLSYVVFSPEQVKNVDNTTPTADPDIRYSDIDELDDLNAQLKAKQNQIYSASMELRKFDAKAEEEKLYAVLQKEGASQKEIDEALQVYSNWGKESGYADAFEKHSALKDEEKLLRREIQKVEDKLHDELKEQIAHWDDEEVKKYVAKAVRKYHTTTRLDKASYLVTTGSMLDFSDGQGYRVKDHREISEILDLPDYAEYSDGMIAFMNMGNIRLQTYGIDVSAMPNAKQFSALRDIIFTVMRENDEFSVDFSKTDGYSAGSVTYGKGTSTSKIIADIKSYFETGVVPEEQSNIRDFLYSDIDAEVDIYEVLGENERLNKENKILRADFERLMERRKLEGQLTHGKQLNENQLDIVAGHIRNLGNSTYSKPKLIEKLRDVYTHIATSDELAWDDLFARFYGIAEDVLDEARPVRSPNEYYANIYKDLRNTEISLSEEQKQYVKSMLGVDAYKAFFGKVKVTDKGIPLNSKLEELASKYPSEFAETNDKDQVLELLEIYETAKELKEMVEEYDRVEQTRWLANEIYNQYWNVSPIRTVADRYDKKIKHLKFEHRTAMKELRDSYNERLEKQKKIDREERSRIFKKLRQDHIKELKEIKNAGKERLNKYKEDAKRKTRIQSVTANALSLNEMLVKNSKDKHIHESMKGPVINLLQAIDFSSKRALGMWGGDMSGVPTNKDISLQRALSQVQQMMADASVGKEELVELYGHELDDDIRSMIDSVDNIMRTVGDNEFILNKMTLEDLTTLDNVVKTIKSVVTKMNQFHVINHAKGIANLSQEEIAYAEKLGKAKVYNDKSLKAGVRKLLAWKNINPYYAFKRLGSAGKKVFGAFQDGYDKFAFNIKEIIDFTNKTYKREEVREWEKEIKSFKLRVPATEMEMSSPDYKPQYQELKMTVAQIMDLYLLSKREAAKAHLLGGGIRVADIETKGSEVISQAEGALLEEKEISEIIKSLTPRQIEVADALSKFMNTTTTDWGNEVSMARFGYKAFGEKNYVPMQVDKNNLAVDDETEKNNSLFRLLNMSFTKGLTEGANNRLVISSIFDVFAQHTSDMAKYNALALPVLDAFRWYNYKEKGYKGEAAFETKSVKQAIENAFGKEGQSYITTFLKDLNGKENTSRDTIGKGFFTKAKIAAVGANLRVALLQPTAYFRASANIDSKYLWKALMHKPKIHRAEQYCGMALWKSLGYFDTNVQRGVADQIKHAESAYDKAIEVSMKGAEWGDKITFGYLWNAAELEVREKRTDLKVGSDEFFFEVGKRLRDVIYSTQVVDSVMTRSEMMRSSDGFDKMLTSFASEPTLSYNMLADAVIQYRLDVREVGKTEAIKKNKKHIGRVLVAYTTTNLVAALIESGFDALRDDDDEEMDGAEFFKLYLENFATNQSILAKIPWLKEAISIVQGFSPSRMDTQGMQTFANAFKQTWKLTQGEGSWGKTIKSHVQAFSYLTGLPFYNAWRDFWASIDKFLVHDEELDEILRDFY